jgi:glucosamine-6-phosphate deaminase
VRKSRLNSSLHISTIIHILRMVILGFCRSSQSGKVSAWGADEQMNNMKVNRFTINVFGSRDEMGRAAVEACLGHIRAALLEKDEVNLVFAAAPSQEEVLKYLRAAPEVQWQRINAFHMDNYVGLEANAPQQFSAFLRRRLFSLLPFRSVNYMGNAQGQEAAYAELLKLYPTDVCFMGIGENGHIAFNDPCNALFEDPELVKMVMLDHACRMQQVNEGNFRDLSEVPMQALTLTVPALMRSRHVICTVPGRNKAAAVRAMIEDGISEDCPASILRRHSSARLYLDREAASLLND